MLGSVNNSSNVSAIQLLNAAHAFKNVKASPSVEQFKTNEPQISEGIDINDDSIITSFWVWMPQTLSGRTVQSRPHP